MALLRSQKNVLKRENSKGSSVRPPYSGISQFKCHPAVCNLQNIHSAHSPTLLPPQFILCQPSIIPVLDMCSLVSGQRFNSPLHSFWYPSLHSNPSPVSYSIIYSHISKPTLLHLFHLAGNTIILCWEFYMPKFTKFPQGESQNECVVPHTFLFSQRSQPCAICCPMPENSCFNFFVPVLQLFILGAQI